MALTTGQTRGSASRPPIASASEPVHASQVRPSRRSSTSVVSTTPTRCFILRSSFASGRGFHGSKVIGTATGRGSSAQTQTPLRTVVVATASAGFTMDGAERGGHPHARHGGRAEQFVDRGSEVGYGRFDEPGPVERRHGRHPSALPAGRDDGDHDERREYHAEADKGAHRVTSQSRSWPAEVTTFTSPWLHASQVPP